MRTTVIVSLGVGTGILVSTLAGLVCLTIALSNCACERNERPEVEVYRPRTGVAGEIERKINERKYGPVDLDAAKEVKNGGLFARIRANRQANACGGAAGACAGSQSRAVTVTTNQVTRTYSGQMTTRSSPSTNSDCANGQCERPNAASSQPGEYPAINPLDVISNTCPTCPVNSNIFTRQEKSIARHEVKTGAFVCSHCRKACIGDEWHTDWVGDGTPITFLCERCYSRMNSNQLMSAYRAYAAKQTASNGKQALMHQEIDR
jgi:hypothetical protein